MTNETIILTKAQADALELVKKDDNLEFIVTNHIANIWTVTSFKALNELSLETLLEAYFCGYKVEKTPEEILLERYAAVMKFRAKSEKSSYALGINTGYSDGIRDTLEALSIKIKGINA